MIEVSLCMIVKNEENVLARCLDSVADLVEEIIIIDTGSADRTKEIAKKYTDKIYDFEWIDDFSAARNFSFEKATKDYIYVADADEVIDEENREKFKQLKQILLPEIDIVQMSYCNQLSFGTVYNFEEELRPKLYKRQREFIWTEPIHEQVRLDPIIYDSEIKILHMPESQHSGRDFKTFQKHIKKGLRLSKRLHHMYAMELFIAGEDEDFLEAEEFFMESVNDETRDLDEIREAVCVVAKSARIRDDVHTLLKMSLRDVATGGSAEVCCELGQYFLDKGEKEEANMWFYNALHEAEPILSIQYKEEIPKHGMELCR